MSSTIGRFIWHELMTTDPEAAMQFYSDVVGWTTKAYGDEGYSMWVGSQGPLGGVMALPEKAKAMGAPSHWMSNVEVGDVDATVALAQKLGGRTYVEPKDVPEIGRVAVIGDPQGASIAVFKPSGTMASHDNLKAGEFSWAEYVGNDHEAAFSFYSQLFGWEKNREHDMGPMGKYLLFGKNGSDKGGMFTMPKDMPMPPSWLYYIRVDDLEAAVERAKAGGGKLLNGPMDVPDGSRIAQLMDPQGAAFALLTAGGKKAS